MAIEVKENCQYSISNDEKSFFQDIQNFVVKCNTNKFRNTLVAKFRSLKYMYDVRTYKQK